MDAGVSLDRVYQCYNCSRRETAGRQGGLERKKQNAGKERNNFGKRRGNGKEVARSTIDSLAVHPCNPGYPRVDFLLPGRLIYLPKPWWRLIHKSHWPSPFPSPCSSFGQRVPQLSRVRIHFLLLSSFCKLEKLLQVYSEPGKKARWLAVRGIRSNVNPLGRLIFLHSSSGISRRSAGKIEITPLLLAATRSSNLFSYMFWLREFHSGKVKYDDRFFHEYFVRKFESMVLG